MFFWKYRWPSTPSGARTNERGRSRSHGSIEPRDGAEVVDVRLLRDADRGPQELVRTGDLDASGRHRGSEAIPPGIEFGFVPEAPTPFVGGDLVTACPEVDAASDRWLRGGTEPHGTGARTAEEPHRPRAEAIEDGSVGHGVDAADLERELDELLDEVDAVLEENAEEFVKAYVQKGGE